VIQIITKRGRARPPWNMTVRQGANWFANQEGRVPTNYWRNPATGQMSRSTWPSRSARAARRSGARATCRGYNLSLSGGAENVRYYIAGDWDGRRGPSGDNRSARGSGRANLTITPFETLDMGSIGYVRGRTDLAARPAAAASPGPPTSRRRSAHGRRIRPDSGAAPAASRRRPTGRSTIASRT
jgi:hypothetical protein